MSSSSYSEAPALGAVLPFPHHASGTATAREDEMRRFEIATGIVERIVDFLTIIAALRAAHFLCGTLFGGAARFGAREFDAVACGAAILVVLFLDKDGAYRPSVSLLAVRETERVLRAVLAGSLLAVVALTAMTRDVPRREVALGSVLVLAALLAEKWLMRALLYAVRVDADLMRRAVIVGTGRLGKRIYSALVRSPRLGIEPVAFVAPDANPDEGPIFEAWYRRERKAQVISAKASAKLLRRLNANVLIVADPECDASEMEAMRREAELAGAAVYLIPEPFADDGPAAEFVEIDGMMLAYRKRHQPRHWYDASKRAIDVLGASTLLMLLSPLFAVAALLVKWTSPGPVIFRQVRVGRSGRRFEMYKFRTMHTACASYASSPTDGRDPRITRVGRLLRHTCIDELPQLVNVLRGEMSLVGPRPEMPFIVAEYEAVHLRRLTVKPGITGLWQLSADRLSPIHHNIAYDLYYVRHRNVLMDLAILLHTALFAFRGV